MRAVHSLAVEDDLEIELPVAGREHLGARRLGDDDPVPGVLRSCFPRASRAHLLVDDGVKCEAATQHDA